MLNNIVAKLESWFGGQPYEGLLRDTKNLKIRNLLTAIAFFRFIFFPIYFSIWILGGAINFVILTLEATNAVLGVLYGTLIDSHWLRLSWFDVTKEELTEECIITMRDQ